MVVTSLKSMAEVRLGNVFALPVNLTFDPWFKAWSSACTGLKCEGLMGGFMNSVIITVPSVIVSIAIASVNGYALANWPYRGANIFHHSDFWGLCAVPADALPNCYHPT